MANEEVTVNCIYCQNPMKVFASDVDKIVRCNTCGRFNKIPGRAQRRMEIQCPDCQNVLSIPLQMRAQLYRCRNCSKEIQLLGPPTLETEIRAITELEQGTPGYKITITISNTGTPANISFVQFGFENSDGEDMGDYFIIKESPDNPSQVLCNNPITLTYTMDVAPNTTPGVVTVLVVLSAKDVLDDSELKWKETFECTVFPQRVFGIQTEHEYLETAGVPFAIQIWAFLPSGDVDASYNGTHTVQFQTNATKSPLGFAPKIPSSLEIDFKEGSASTEREFFLTNSTETPQIISFEDSVGGPKGSSEPVTVKPGDFQQFEIFLESPQMNGCPFRGKNEIHAQDRYGNFVEFAEDIWINAANNLGDIQVGGKTNIIPASAFQHGIADLSGLKVTYNIEKEVNFPFLETFLVSYQDKEGHSSEILIQKNPIEIKIGKIAVPEIVEQSQNFSITVEIINFSERDLKIFSNNLAMHFFINGENADSLYKARCQEQTIVLPKEGESLLPLEITALESAQTGITKFEITITALETEHAFVGKSAGNAQWTVEPKGRIFQCTQPLKVEAGKAFAVEIAAYLNDKIDTTYSGKKNLIFQSEAIPSPNNIEPQIPEQMEVVFKDGIGKTASSFIFTNATEENQSITVKDSGPGGAASKEIPISVMASKLDYFCVFFQSELINGDVFAEHSQIMAMDAYGNLVPDFSKPCLLYPASQKGQILIDGRLENTIPASCFNFGVADISELRVSYLNDVQDKLPRHEEFCVICDNKKGQSKPVNILPRPAKVLIVRCSTPEEVEQSRENYPFYLGLENGGDIPANISSILFSFSQKGDVSSHYTILPSPENSKRLIPGVPLQLSYTIKVGPRAPVGITYGEAKITGVDAESSLPLQAKTSFQWKIELKGRVFQVYTEHQNKEAIGSRFGLKVACYLENQSKDVSFSGEKTLTFQSTATAAPNGTSPVIPDRLNITFMQGDATTGPEFMLVHSDESPTIQARDPAGNIQGQTSPISLRPGSLGSFKISTESEIRNGALLEGTNSIVALDSFGNTKKDFSEDVMMSFANAQAWFTNESGQKVTSISGRWFNDGMAELTSRRLVLYCDPEQKLPVQATLKVMGGGKQSQSNTFKILPRPITVVLDKVECAARVVQGFSCPVKIKLINQGDSPVKVKNIDIRLYSGEKVYSDLEVKPDPSNPAPITGSAVLTYIVPIPPRIPVGRASGKTIITLVEPGSQTGLELQGQFVFQTEPSGRSFAVETENHQKEMAGVPFGLRLMTMIGDQPDTTYEGESTILFLCNAAASQGHQSSSIPEMLTLKFNKGQAITSREFVLVSASEQPEIKVKDKFEGGPAGISSKIEVKPAELQSFNFVLHNAQTNGTPFQGENKLTALDIFGNIKTNFKDDVRIRGENHKADILIGENRASNIVPGNAFRSGLADLSALGFIYLSSEADRLPYSDRLIAVYGEKQGISGEVAIQPRPAGILITDFKMPENVCQGDKEIVFTFKLTNKGDSNLSISEIGFKFFTEDGQNELSPQFSVSAHANNPAFLIAGSVSSWTYALQANDNAFVGKVRLGVTVQGSDAVSEGYIEAKSEVCFNLAEKPREFKITTEHDNLETVGQPFRLKIITTKEGEQDLKYEGFHEIRFSLTLQGSNGFKPSYPESEVVEFAGGAGHTTGTFILTNAAERPSIIAEEKGKAVGKSKEITLRPGKAQSLKVTFDKPEEAGYTLQTLDQFNNIVGQSLMLDDDIKPGSLLTGSAGTYYEIHEIVGHGAMGKVYKGKRLNDNMIVAIKTTLFNALSDISRFILEGLMLIRFDHPNIVKGYDLRQMCTRESNKAQIKFFMVMEFLPGHSVKDELDSSKTGVLSIPLATKIILHSARALAYMWEHQTIHRDIKPENIQMTEGGKIKLIDLGIARAESGEVDIYLTQKDTIVGSYPYISPERLKGSSIDFRSDIYSLGATFYHIVTGMPPYLDTYKGPGGKDLLEYLIKIRTKKMPTPPDKLVDMPPIISDIIMTMLNIRAQKRCDTAEQLVESLEKVYAEVKG